jgi:hypothetical protein
MRMMIHGSEPAPVKCDYCGTVALVRVSNCGSCGGALPWPEETIVEREIDITRELLDVATMGDACGVYIVGRRSAILRETVRRVERTP